MSGARPHPRLAEPDSQSWGSGVEEVGLWTHAWNNYDLTQENWGSMMAGTVNLSPKLTQPAHGGRQVVKFWPRVLCEI
jgi:hypothetical protein